MKYMIMIVLVFASVSSGDVISGTIHRSDAQLVDDIMEETGIYNGRVKILYYESLTVYAVEFPGDYFDWDDDNDILEVSSFFVAVAIVSASTSWHSDMAIALYEDVTLGMFTSDCRTIIRLMNEGHNVEKFFLNNILTGDRSESELDL